MGETSSAPTSQQRLRTVNIGNKGMPVDTFYYDSYETDNSTPDSDED